MEKPGAEEIRQRFVRWQETRNEQLTSVNRLIIGLSTGTLGALLAVARDGAGKNPKGAVIAAWVLAAFAASISFVSGLGLAANRYDSFRLTARIAKMKRKDPTERTQDEKSQIACLKCRVKRKDRHTLCLLRFQVWSFAVSAPALVVAEILDVYRGR